MPGAVKATVNVCGTINSERVKISKYHEYLLQEKTKRNVFVLHSSACFHEQKIPFTISGELLSAGIWIPGETPEFLSSFGAILKNRIDMERSPQFECSCLWRINWPLFLVLTRVETKLSPEMDCRVHEPHLLSVSWRHWKQKRDELHQVWFFSFSIEPCTHARYKLPIDLHELLITR